MKFLMFDNFRRQFCSIKNFCVPHRHLFEWRKIELQSSEAYFIFLL